MVNLFIGNGELDIYDGQSVELEYTPVRFQDAITEQYTTDFTIPNNKHNAKLLEVSGLLDSDHRFGGKLEPATLSINGEILNVYLQVVSIDNDDITVAVYEKYIPTEIMNKTILDFIKDSDYSIWDWNIDSENKLPSVFKNYVYGPFLDYNYAQYHPSVKVNDVLLGISLSSGYSLPFTRDDLWLMASNKFVCPQNKSQVIEINFSDGQYGNINGGQHIVNDLEWNWDPDTKTVTFNRTANATMSIYISYERKQGWTQDCYFETILRNGAGAPSQVHSTLIETSQYRNKVVTDTYQVAHNYIDNGCEMQFRMQQVNHFKLLNAVIIINYSGYDITDDDYSIDMQYVARYPRLLITDYVEDHNDRYAYFDGHSYPYTYTINQVDIFTPPIASFCRIGLYCNLPATKLKDLLFGLQWVTETKFQKTNWEYFFDRAYDSYEIDGEITLFETTNDKLGQKSHLIFTGEEIAEDNTVCEVDNFWMEPDQTLHESPFTYSLKQYGNWAYFPQYSDRERDEEKDSYDCKYDAPEGLPLARTVDTAPNILLRVVLPDFGFDEVTEATTVTIETYDNVKRADYVYLHGRKFMVQEINTDITTGKSVIKAIEIWRKVPKSPIVWPPQVEITDIGNITEHTANVSFTIDQIE